MTLDDIKRDIPHDEDCPLYECFGSDDLCSDRCTRRDKIALLERLQEPTTEMAMAYWTETGGSIPAEKIRRGIQAANKAAEEAQR